MSEKVEYGIKKLDKRLFRFKPHFKKICSVCSKEFMGFINSKICPECKRESAQKTWENTHCYLCGRKISYGRGLEGKRLCSFCLRNIKSKIAPPTIKRKYCKNCGKRIIESTFLKKDGYCKTCFNIKKETLETEEILRGVT
jgi:hypothetical protein